MMTQRDIDREIGGNIESARTIRHGGPKRQDSEQGWGHGRRGRRWGKREGGRGGQYGNRVVGQPRRRKGKWQHYGKV